MRLKYLKNVVSLKLDTQKCTGCGMCVQVCPHDVFTIKEAKSVIGDKDYCMECGACSKNCPFSAIEVNSGVGCFRAILNGKRNGSEDCC